MCAGLLWVGERRMMGIEMRMGTGRGLERRSRLGR